MEASATTLTAIRTYCAACDNDGITAWDASTRGFTLDEYLAGLRQHCPDCGASGRTVTVLAQAPDQAVDPGGAALWADLQDWMRHDAEPRRSAARVGRNEPCPCGSGKKYKRCCGSSI